MGAISHFHRHFSDLYAKAKQGNIDQPRENKILATSPVEQLFLGNGDYWNDYLGDNPTLKTVVGLFLSMATIGIAPIAILIHKWLNEDEAQIEQDSGDRTNAINQMHIQDPRVVSWLLHLDMSDVRMAQRIFTLLESNNEAIFNFLVSEKDQSKQSFVTLVDNPINIVITPNRIILVHDGEEVMLMSSAQYLSNFKDRLGNANLNGANFFGVNFNAANLTNAQLLNVQIIGTRFHGAIFDNAQMTLALPAVWNEESLQLYVNHLPVKLVDVFDEESSRIHQRQRQQENKTGSILTAIDSIDDRYPALKLQLMHQVIASLKGVDTSCVNESLKGILESRDIYKNDDIIKEFIQKINDTIATAKMRHISRNAQAW